MEKFIIKNPIITEKAGFASHINKYIFKVAKNASSAEIRKAVNDIYKVHVVKINIINIKAKHGYFRGVPNSLKKQGFKKAVVTIKEGETIDVIAK